MDAQFHREYLLRLPLPLAQLYSRAYNAKDARSRHDNCYYLFEVLIKLSACPLTACYVQGLRQGGPRVAKLDQLLLQLAFPSLGQWMGILREMARHYGALPDSASHPLGQMWSQLNRPHAEPSALVALYRRIKNGPDGQPTWDKSCTVLQLFEALVQYRNAVIGHGAGRFESFYADEMGPLLFPAVNEILAEGIFSPLGPAGARLAYLTELRAVSEDRFELGMRELTGAQGERMAPLPLEAAEAAGLAPNRAAVLWPGRKAPLRLDPLLIFRESEIADELLLLNGDRNGRQVEYLSYTTGRTERTKDTVTELAALLSTLAGKEVTESKLQELAEQSRTETPSVEALVEPSAAVRRLGDYEILAEIGRGGMGVVYLARQLSLGRLVALKMLPADLAGDEVALSRFRREMRALGRCDHPNIVKLLDSGTFPDGQVYYTMEYVSGCDLDQVWTELSKTELSAESSKLGNTTFARAVISASGRRRKEVESRCVKPAPGEAKPGQPPEAPKLPLPPLPPLPTAADDIGGYVRQVAALVRDAALALQAVHDQGIVHRDISPANLMLTPDGTRVVLMDFGLAKGQNLSRSLTEKGGFVGKLRYAAPEQLASSVLKVGPQADVRGLGVTLWELLTRRRLFAEAQDERQLAELVHNADVPRLRQVDPSFDADMEAIVARATERNAADRIESAGRLAEYLQLYLDGKPIPIRTPTLREILYRWAREHKAAVAAATIVLATILGALVAVTIEWKRTTIAEKAAEIQKGIAEGQRRKADEKTKEVELQKQFVEEQRRKAEDEAQRAIAAEKAAKDAEVLERQAKERADEKTKEVELQKQNVEEQRRKAEDEAQKALAAEKVAKDAENLERQAKERSDEKTKETEQQKLIAEQQRRKAEDEAQKATAAEKAARDAEKLERQARETADEKKKEAEQQKLIADDQRRQAEDETQKAKAVTDFMQDMLASVDPASARGREVTVRTMLDDASKKVGDKFHAQPLVEASVRATIGDTYKALGLYNAAEPQLLQAMQIRQRLLGKDHPDTVRSMSNLADLECDQGKFREAEDLYRQALAAGQRILGKENPDTLSSMAGLACALSGQGKQAEAEELFRQALAAMQRVLGKDHPDTISAMSNLASTLGAQQKYPEAEELYREALAAMQRVLGQDHPDAISSMNNLAVVLDNQGKYAEAEQLYRQALAAMQRVLGRDHPDTLKCMKNLAEFLDARGKTEEARQIRAEQEEILHQRQQPAAATGSTQ